MLNILIKYKTKIVFGGLVFVLGQFPCFAQSSGDTATPQTSGADQQIPPAIARELDAMRKRIDELEAELKNAKAPERPCASGDERESDRASSAGCYGTCSSCSARCDDV